MPVLVSIHVPGMTREQYDELSAALEDQLKAAPGLYNHYAWHDEEGIGVVEIWASAAEHESWFDGTIAPHLPPGVQVQKHEIFSVVSPDGS